MARFFKPKRRRPNSGPNKNQQKVLRREQESRSGGTLQERFPGVESLVLDLQFISASGEPYDRIERRVSAKDPCDFSAPCPGRCGDGQYDLEQSVRSLVQDRRETTEEHLVCRETVYGDQTKTCDFRLTLRITLRYSPS